MVKGRWGDWAYYSVILGVGLFSMVTGVVAMDRWGSPSGWGLLALWVVLSATVLSAKLRADRRKRDRPAGR